MMNKDECWIDRGWEKETGSDTPQPDENIPRYFSHRSPSTLPTRLRLMARKSPVGWDQEIRLPVLEAADTLDALEQECFTLAAGQCCVKSGGLVADDHGHQYCDMQRQRDELRGKLRVMANIMGDALRVMKTIEEGESDDESALDSLRAKMAGAIDSVRRAEMAADKASAQSSPVEAPSAS